VTVSDKFICPSCSLDGEPSPALDICASCQSAAVEKGHSALDVEGLLGESWALTDAGLLAESRVGGQPEPATRLLAFEAVEELALHRGRLVWVLADRVTDLESQLDVLREQLERATCRSPSTSARPFRSRSPTRSTPVGLVRSSPRTRASSWRTRTKSSKPCTKRWG
jgi:hypothetical protein